jgi:hypothetical protein
VDMGLLLIFGGIPWQVSQKLSRSKMREWTKKVYKSYGSSAQCSKFLWKLHN